ncbi:4'-phosphopantetheinyl transferase family protein [Psychroflexus aestuariivivens]|uniref:4'-phosphopantetheinyl transferase family protein n=1 Tax=Psychroflexus aestuariivivens TaxID=1795040 RepID=UPI000FD6F183|nr:4'-phosphopantetheinyl transferase superfamily protein [Psychroflexus aestuariivivens]
MIGNDIVDLNLAKASSNIFRPRYFKKILNTSELSFIQESQDQFLCFWRIWTLKEAAYKAFQRLFLFDNFYNPKLFSTTIINSELALVSYQNQILEFKSKMNSKYIYSWTSSDKNRQNIIGSCKSEVKRQINQSLNLESFNLNKDENGFPFVQVLKQKASISISHHGQFYAVII